MSEAAAPPIAQQAGGPAPAAACASRVCDSKCSRGPATCCGSTSRNGSRRSWWTHSPARGIA